MQGIGDEIHILSERFHVSDDVVVQLANVAETVNRVEMVVEVCGK